MRAQTAGVRRRSAHPAHRAPPPLPVVAEPTAEEKRNALARGRNIDLMGEAELRTYARCLGIKMRDAQELAVDRLRQNCKIVLGQIIEALTE